MFKKKIIGISCLAISSLTLASCHTPYSLPEFKAPKTFDESTTYEIEFWSKNDGSKVQADIYEKAIESFEKIYPNIKVNLKSYTSYDTIYRDIITNISTGTTPNVAICYPDNVATYAKGSNIVVSLDKLINNKSYGLDGTDLKYTAVGKDNIYTKFFEEGNINGTYYTLPYVRSSEALYINQDYLKQLIDNNYLSLSDYANYGVTSYNEYGVPDIPTWDWLWAASNAALKAKENGIPKTAENDPTLYPFIYKSSDNWTIQYLKQMGADYTTIDGEVKLFNSTTTNFLSNLSTHALNGEYSTFTLISYPGNFFNKWESLMCIDSTAGSTWIGYDATVHDNASTAKGDRFETAVRIIPQVDPTNPQMISQGPSLCIFNKYDTEEVVASWIFMQYLLTDEIQYSYAKTEGYIPVTKSAVLNESYQNYLKNADGSEYQVKIDASNIVLDNIDNTFITPVFNGSADVRNAAGYLVNAVTGNPKKYTSVEAIKTLYQKAITNNNLDQLIIADY